MVDVGSTMHNTTSCKMILQVRWLCVTRPINYW